MHPIRTLQFLLKAFFHRATPWYVKGLLLLALIYTAWPADLVPDFLVPYGWLDDLIIAPLLALLAWRFLPAWLAADIRKTINLRSR